MLSIALFLIHIKPWELPNSLNFFFAAERDICSPERAERCDGRRRRQVQRPTGLRLPAVGVAAFAGWLAGATCVAAAESRTWSSLGPALRAQGGARGGARRSPASESWGPRRLRRPPQCSYFKLVLSGSGQCILWYFKHQRSKGGKCFLPATLYGVIQRRWKVKHNFFVDWVWFKIYFINGF